jgi:hypothetical protein
VRFKNDRVPFPVNDHIGEKVGRTETKLYPFDGNYILEKIKMYFNKLNNMPVNKMQLKFLRSTQGYM